MNPFRSLGLAGLLVISSFTSFATAPNISTVEEYNASLPIWGTSWAPGSKSVNGYYPSFYTGFAMRSEFPERIFVKTARGNNTRLTVILDEQTLTDYLFDLSTRAAFYNKMAERGSIDIQPRGAGFIPQLSYFTQVVNSPVYGIQSFVDGARNGQQSNEAIYSKSLEVLKALNPGRVFQLNINLVNEFNRWKGDMAFLAQGDAKKITSNASNTVIAINTLVFGRVNYHAKPTAQVMAKLETALNAALNNAPADEFVLAANDLFKEVTGSKYQIQVVNTNGQFQSALQCQGAGYCMLNYPEFTAIYPTGSVQEKTSDEFGNSINSFATPGLWNFLQRSGRSVDNIRKEPYYGFAPKMDFQDIGNGFHNPAVSFWDVGSKTKQALGLPANTNTLASVKRGGVSHGCLRLPLGSIWEMRQIFPVENEKMTQVQFVGSRAQDFDVYDINGDGRPEIMGVEYFISYGLAGADGLAQREGSNLEINGNKKLEFYSSLYGARNVFFVENDQYLFTNPSMSVASYQDLKRASIAARFRLNGTYPLYEQKYEQDKAQFYALPAINNEMIQLMGRAKGCAPSSNPQTCGSAAFEKFKRGLGQ